MQDAFHLQSVRDTFAKGFRACRVFLARSIGPSRLVYRVMDEQYSRTVVPQDQDRREQA